MNADYSASSFRMSHVAIGRAQLRRQQHRLPGRRPGRGERPAGHQGHGPDGRPGAGERRPARLAVLRDPAHGGPGHRVRLPEGAGRAGAGGCGARTGTTPCRWLLFLAVRWMQVFVSTAAGCSPRPTCTTGSARSSIAAAGLAVLLFNILFSMLVERLGAGLPVAASRASCPSTTRTSGSTSGSGSWAGQPDCSTAPRSRTCCGGCWACGSGAGCSTTAARCRRRRWSPSATTWCSTRAA